MNRAEFRSDRAGGLELREFRGLQYQAFVPVPLPPLLTYSPELVLILSRADANLGELSGVGRRLPNPHVLMAPYVRREAVLSSRIEGTQTSLTEVFEDELANEEATAEDAEVQEVRNYVTALEYGIAQVSAGRRLSLELVLELHQRLMHGVRGKDKQPGEFRTTQNWIGHERSTPATAKFVPPHPDRVDAALTAWIDFARQGADDVPPLVACALLHQQFETIHPFRDGNGRIGRLVIPLFLMERHRLPLPLLYISAYIDQHKAEYARLLQGVRTDGDWEAWVEFFANGVAATAREAGERATEIVDYYETAREAATRNPNSVRLLRELLANPFMSTARAAKALDVTNPTARKAIDDLKLLGILTDAPKRGRTPLVVARVLLDIFNRPAS